MDGEELGSDEDIDWIGGNTPYGEASRGTLVHLSNKLGADDERTELFTSPDPRSCRFESNVEERRFLASVFWWTCLPEAEAKRLREDFDDIVDDAEVSVL